MSTVLDSKPTVRDYASGDVVEPGVYIDVENGAVVQIHERDELPDGSRLIHYARRFRKIAGANEPAHN